MKKLVLLCILFLTSSLFANEIFYTGSVKNLYETSKSNSTKGRLLPTSKVEILGEENNRYKIKIVGFVKEGVEHALYFTQKNRILVAGLSKNNSFEVLSSEKTGNEDFSQLELVAFIDKDDLTKDLNSLYVKAAELYGNNCGICHSAHDKKEFTANLWPSVMKSMLSRTALTKEDNYLVVQYLQKHSKDME
ncbi:cytochrome C [Arcobacter porcinus]|uniref:Cytochrome c-type protein TorC n=1 Tax=Arcobacter porcinus TaxID=1935204 RepID=A0A1C0AXE4_9BACT|nr:cytochrome C [Arcobacter porcinus]OCL97400.1 Cytochrome c-type protein TorC [Aliarcobacter thereius]OCL84313.1 Cytochrome c-type protein TorC [Arcobacter porcinus]OCL84834.1 Cytochrome c-type protein TorC [Arcobacter porcinus]OCL89370.1 Cytochrome c-type protein TorC [Arcobacter porcinus]OCL91789.1 Cytochrome c-type protein TorC [Arcobacter porcinus]